MSLALRATQPAPSSSEHELVAAVRRGSDTAFEELYSRYRGRIGSYILGMVGDHGRAEDIAQEVFISALRRLRDTERPIAFKPWIYEIAKNACIDEFRRARRRQEVPLDGEEGPRVLSVVAMPEAAVESKQSLDDLRGAFRGLSKSHHKIIVLRELEGLSYSQIGERMGMSKPVVESTLFRARRRLGEEYNELVSGRRCEHVQMVIARGEQPRASSMGVRERRQLARHLAHCQPCRRHARMAGVDDSFFETPGLIGKIAALLPFPWLRLRHGHHDEDAVGATGSHPVSAIQQLQSVAQYADPTAPALGLGRAAAAAAALVIGGAGGGFVTLAGHGTSSRPAPTGGAQQLAALVAPASGAGAQATAPGASWLGGGSRQDLALLGVTPVGASQAGLHGLTSSSTPLIATTGMTRSPSLRPTNSGAGSRIGAPIASLGVQSGGSAGASRRIISHLPDVPGIVGSGQRTVARVLGSGPGSGPPGQGSSGHEGQPSGPTQAPASPATPTGNGAGVQPPAQPAVPPSSRTPGPGAPPKLAVSKGG